MKIGIDLGGTKTEIIVLASDNKEVYRRRVRSPQGRYEETLSNIQQLIDQAESELGVQATIGIGIPGSISAKTGTVKNSNSTWLNGRPLLSDLQELLQRNIKLENDANCLVLSEVTDGAAAGANSAFGVIIGTGCGGGLYLNGGLVIGANGLGGEWGHTPLPYPRSSVETYEQGIGLFDHQSDLPASDIYKHSIDITYHVNDQLHLEIPGARCYCGKRGCLETWISGPAFEADYYRSTNKKSRAIDIVEQAGLGCQHALDALDRYIERLAKSLSQVINIIDPDVIVLGGGMSNITQLYDELPERCLKYVFSDEYTIRIVKAIHGDSSGVRGAAFLWDQ